MPFFNCAQIGGVSGYQVLTNSSRSVALAGTAISIADGDLSLFFENPAVLDSVTPGNIFLNINPYFADISAFNGAYAFNWKKMGVFSVGLDYVDYNSFEMTDATGTQTGEFDAQDYSFVIGKAHQVGPFSLGLNLKLLHSSIEVYGSTVILGDVGGLFRVSRNWTIGMVFSNMGGRISNFTELQRVKIPFDVKIGTTFKPEYMPLRFTLTSINLANKNAVVASNLEEGRSTSRVENIFRRLSIGTELLLSKNFHVLFGYNHKRKQELKLNDIAGGSGFSYGLMLKVKRIELRFSRATYHAAGGSGFISLQTNLNDFRSFL